MKGKSPTLVALGSDLQINVLGIRALIEHIQLESAKRLELVIELESDTTTCNIASHDASYL